MRPIVKYNAAMENKKCSNEKLVRKGSGRI
jgi:hypothetical protein